METLLRRHFWILDLAVVALCAALLGLAASGYAATKLAGVPPPTVAIEPHFPKPLREAGFDKQPTAIVERNIFCSSCPPPRVDETDIGRDTMVPTEAKTTLPLTLLAIMYAPASSLGNLSIAILKHTDSKSTGAFAVGGKTLGATITQVLETRIYLDHDGATEYLDLLETTAPSPSLAATKATLKDSDPFSAALDRGTRKQAERHYEIQRSTLDTILENVAQLSRLVRPVPEVRNGKMAGFRLYAVKPDGPLARIGVHNGDIISSINGLELTSTEKAIEAFGKLKSASHLALRLERGNQRLTNEYDIR